MSKVLLQPKPFPPASPGSTHRHFHWTKCLPFVVNTRGVMIHRVRYGLSHWWDGEWDHDSFTYWCGNLASGAKAELYADPPKDRLLCERCEAMAHAAGLPTADELAGRHVHTGRMIAKRTCCEPMN